jgi:hypothetical protein
LGDAAAAVPAKLDFSGAERRCFRGDAQVAAAREFQTTPNGVAANRSNQWLSKLKKLPAVLAPVSLFPIGAVLIERGDVAASAERPCPCRH